RVLVGEHDERRPTSSGPYSLRAGAFFDAPIPQTHRQATEVRSSECGTERAALLHGLWFPKHRRPDHEREDDAAVVAADAGRTRLDRAAVGADPRIRVDAAAGGASPVDPGPLPPAADPAAGHAGPGAGLHHRDVRSPVHLRHGSWPADPFRPRAARCLPFAGVADE